MTTVRFFFDFASPYSYLAATQLDALATRSGATFVWTPVYLPGIMKATGNQPPASLPQRALYMGDDLVRWATVYNVPYAMSPHFPVASLHALRAATAVQHTAPERFAAFATACFRATWADGEDISDRAVLARLATSVDVDPALAAGASNEPRWKDALKAATEAAVATGAFGVPAFVVDDDELYFGNDRLTLLEQRLQRGAPFPRATARVHLPQR